ncbi:hypothetical protein EDD85DRAFT_995182 [Armillaria nabsnona]|nr:hypothetical protein EDD85DRAFT_995182 [Armillaria nabsnona]
MKFICQDRLQYYDHSSIIVSQEIDMGKDPESFIAMLIGLHRLTLEKHGIHSIVEDPILLCKIYTGASGRHCDTVDGTLVVLTLGKIIFRQPGIIGRDTCIIEATAEDCEEWKGMETVVKISWQAKLRPSEKDFMNEVKNAVDKDGASHNWVADHLPNILLSQDFGMAEDSPQARLKEYFDTASYADGDSFEYERQVCRIMVQEKLIRSRAFVNLATMLKEYLTYCKMGLCACKNHPSGYKHDQPHVAEEEWCHLWGLE